MKIANVMSSKVLGGVEQAFLDYNEALSFEGNQVFAFYNKRGKIKDKLKEIKNVTYLPSTFFKPTFLLFPFYWLAIKSIKPDVILVHSKKVLSMFSAIGKLEKIPVVAVCHNEKTKVIDRADYIFSITQYQKEIFMENGFDGNKIFVIPNMITEKMNYEEFKGFSNPPIFGIIGRFDPMKGFSTFIESCSILKEKGIPFKAKIAGSPQFQYLDEYKRIKYLVKYYKLENEVEFLGWIDNKDEFYKHIDVFVLPSNYEPFGIVLLEAMMYSRPIISSSTQGPNEIFKNTKAAITFEPNNKEQLADLMINITKDVVLAKELSQEGYKLVNDKYSMDRVAKTLEIALLEIIKKHIK